MNVINLDYEGSVTTDINDFFAELTYFIDYSFDKRGTLQIKVDCDGILAYHSFTLPRIYDFVLKNATYEVGMGEFVLDVDYVDSFKTFDINNVEQVLTLLEISESLDNYYMVKK